MRTSWARLAIGVAVAGGLTVATAGIASAHNLGMSGAAVCLDGGGWQATATLTLDDNPGNPPPVTGTVTASYPSGRAAQSFAVQATESATFGQGTVVPVDIPSVTFTVTGTFGDGYAFTSDVVVTQPVDCEPTTTSSTTTSTTTAPPTTEPRTATTVAPTTSATTSPTTSTTTPTTTTVPEILSITAITPVCMRDVPYVRVVFGDQPQYDGRTATITFLDVRGIEVARHTAPFAANASVTFIYPGAGVDAGGRATDWPGWVFDGDDWVPDPTDRHLRDGLTVRVEVNPTAVGQVAYPPATSGCANPPASDDGALRPPDRARLRSCGWPPASSPWVGSSCSAPRR